MINHAATLLANAERGEVPDAWSRRFCVSPGFRKTENFGPVARLFEAMHGEGADAAMRTSRAKSLVRLIASTPLADELRRFDARLDMRPPLASDAVVPSQPVDPSLVLFRTGLDTVSFGGLRRSLELEASGSTYTIRSLAGITLSITQSVPGNSQIPLLDTGWTAMVPADTGVHYLDWIAPERFNLSEILFRAERAGSEALAAAFAGNQGYRDVFEKESASILRLSAVVLGLVSALDGRRRTEVAYAVPAIRAVPANAPVGREALVASREWDLKLG